MADDQQGDPTLDGPVAAPDHHRVVFENDRVRVVETVIRAGDTTPLHSHLTPHLLIFTSGSRFVRRDAEGAVMLDTRLQGPDFVIPTHAWNDGTGAHTLENVGPDDILATAVELKP
jgi:hypothetical protein